MSGARLGAGQQRRAEGGSTEPALVGVAGVVLEAFPEGALWWADERLLVVADLHLEKGSSFARRGQMLPPYDTAETLGPPRAADRPPRPGDRRRARRQLSRRRRRRAPVGPRPRRRSRRCRRDATGSGSPATTIPARRPGLPAPISTASRSGPWSSATSRFQATRAARSPATSTPRRGWSGAASRSAGAASPATASAWCCPPSAPMPAGSNVLDEAYRGLFAAATFRAFVLGEDRVYAVGRRALRPD